MRPRIRCLALLGVAVAAGCAEPATLIPEPISIRVGSFEPAALERWNLVVPRRRYYRSTVLIEAFRSVGCPPEHLFVEAVERQANVLCTLPGSSPRTIVIGAPLDRFGSGLGIVNGWTSVALLPVLYEALGVEPRHHTYVFAGFAATMNSEMGAREYLGDLGSEGRSQLAAMVSLRGLGVGTTATGSNGDSNLRQDLFSASRALGVELRLTQLPDRMMVDATPFALRGIPSLVIHSFTPETARLQQDPILDQSQEHIDYALYHESARLIATFLAYLDQTLLRR